MTRANVVRWVAALAIGRCRGDLAVIGFGKDHGFQFLEGRDLGSGGRELIHGRELVELGNLKRLTS